MDDEIIIRQYREKNDIDNETQLYLQVTSTSFYFYDVGEDGKWRRNIKTKKDWKLSKQRSKYKIECFSQHSRREHRRSKQLHLCTTTILLVLGVKETWMFATYVRDKFSRLGGLTSSATIKLLWIWRIKFKWRVKSSLWKEMAMD